MVEGGVWGGACEVVMSCDVIIAAEGATFAITPAKLGVPYDIEGTLSFLQSVGLRVMKEMLFTARPMPAERALQVGIVNQVVPVERLEAATAELVASIVRNSPLVISLLKNVIERAVIRCDRETLSIDESCMRCETFERPQRSTTLREMLTNTQKEMIEAALEECRGRVSGPSGAAVKLGIPRSTLESRIRSLQINKWLFRSERRLPSISPVASRPLREAVAR